MIPLVLASNSATRSKLLVVLHENAVDHLPAALTDCIISHLEAFFHRKSIHFADSDECHHGVADSIFDLVKKIKAFVNAIA